MVTVKRQHTWEWIIIIVALVLLLLAAWALLRPTAHPTDKSQQATSTQPDQAAPKKPTSAKQAPVSNQSTQPPVETPAAPNPATLRTLTISQLGIAIGYDKSLPGVSYVISRTPAGTQYVDLMNEQLEGDICTNDDGTFASIIKNPTSGDQAALTTTVKVGDDTYGLSLPSAGCTSNADLFSKYQASIKATFPYLALSAE